MNHGYWPLLVGGCNLPLWKIWLRPLGLWNSQYMETCSKPPTRLIIPRMILQVISGGPPLWLRLVGRLARHPCCWRRAERWYSSSWWDCWGVPTSASCKVIQIQQVNSDLGSKQMDQALFNQLIIRVHHPANNDGCESFLNHGGPQVIIKVICHVWTANQWSWGAAQFHIFQETLAWTNIVFLRDWTIIQWC